MGYFEGCGLYICMDHCGAKIYGEGNRKFSSEQKTKQQVNIAYSCVRCEEAMLRAYRKQKCGACIKVSATILLPALIIASCVIIIFYA